LARDLGFPEIPIILQPIQKQAMRRVAVPLCALNFHELLAQCASAPCWCALLVRVNNFSILNTSTNTAHTAQVHV
jgi:hypothetical protein